MGLVISRLLVNLDAFSIYLTLAAVFIAQATNTPLSTGDLLVILGVSLLTSKGAHGVPGSAIVALAGTLSALPVIPAIGLVLVLWVDWFMGMARALGNRSATAWEGDIDRERANRVPKPAHRAWLAISIRGRLARSGIGTCPAMPGSQVSGFRSPSTVGISSETVGWMCIARWITV